MMGEKQSKASGEVTQVSIPGDRSPRGWQTTSVEVDAAEEWSRARAEAAQGPHGWRIVILADDPDLGDWLLEEFRSAGSTVALATSGQEGLELIQSSVVDVVISEMGLPDLPGMDLLRQLQSMPKMPKVILTTSRHSDFLVSRAIEHGASAVLCKPFRMERLLALVAHALGN
jgi:DNA-binding NtrC family response regulator